LAYAESDPRSTPIGVAGILENPGYGSYAITDEATGVRYDVIEIGEYFTDRLVGTRVIVYGSVLEGYDPPVLAEWWTQEAPAGEQPEPEYVQRSGLCTEPLQPYLEEMYTDGLQHVTHPCTPPSA